MKIKTAILLAVLATSSCGDDSASPALVSLPTSTLSDTGAIGPQGPQGPAGPQGTPGADGFELTTEMVCTKGIGNLGPSLLFFNYIIWSTTSGDKLVSCAVQDAHAEYSNFVVFKSTQVGATTSHCALGYDADGVASGGFFNFDLNSGVPQVIYHDSGDTADGRDIGMALTDCATH